MNRLIRYPRCRGALLCLTSILSIALFTAPSARAADLNASERAAIKLVEAWVAAWQSKDPQKIAAFFSDDVQLRTGANYNKPELKIGREEFLKIYADDMND